MLVTNLDDGEYFHPANCECLMRYDGTQVKDDGTWYSVSFITSCEYHGVSVRDLDLANIRKADVLGLALVERFEN